VSQFGPQNFSAGHCPGGESSRGQKLFVRDDQHASAEENGHQRDVSGGRFENPVEGFLSRGGGRGTQVPQKSDGDDRDRRQEGVADGVVPQHLLLPDALRPGGILAVVPGKLAIAGFAPPLDAAGNSVRGQVMVASVARALGLNLFGA